MVKLTFFVMLREVIYFVIGKSVNFDVFFHPDRYLTNLPLDSIISDGKVSRQGVDAYKLKILQNVDTGPIILLKDPNQDLYVVLDGHHRYHANVELGKKRVKSAVVGDSSSVLFYLARHGRFQPNPRITDSIRNPMMELQYRAKQLSTCLKFKK